ncbi:MAG: hypothetical protein EZS28_025269, partial [Streblomastix strix]
ETYIQEEELINFSLTSTHVHFVQREFDISAIVRIGSLLVTDEDGIKKENEYKSNKSTNQSPLVYRTAPRIISTLIEDSPTEQQINAWADGSITFNQSQLVSSSSSSSSKSQYPPVSSITVPEGIQQARLSKLKITDQRKYQDVVQVITNVLKSKQNDKDEQQSLPLNILLKHLPQQMKQLTDDDRDMLGISFEFKQAAPLPSVEEDIQTYSPITLSADVIFSRLIFIDRRESIIKAAQFVGQLLSQSEIDELEVEEFKEQIQAYVEPLIIQAFAQPQAIQQLFQLSLKQSLFPGKSLEISKKLISEYEKDGVEKGKEELKQKNKENENEIIKTKLRVNVRLGSIIAALCEGVVEDEEQKEKESEDAYWKKYNKSNTPSFTMILTNTSAVADHDEEKAGKEGLTFEVKLGAINAFDLIQDEKLKNINKNNILTNYSHIFSFGGLGKKSLGKTVDLKDKEQGEGETASLLLKGSVGNNKSSVDSVAIPDYSIQTIVSPINGLLNMINIAHFLSVIEKFSSSVQSQLKEQQKQQQKPKSSVGFVDDAQEERIIELEIKTRQQKEQLKKVKEEKEIENAEKERLKVELQRIQDENRKKDEEKNKRIAELEKLLAAAKINSAASTSSSPGKEENQ